MQTRALPYAVLTVAITAIAVTALPWFNLRNAGFDISWNGLGMASADADGLAPHGRGWLIVAACLIAVLAALTALMPAPAAKPLARLLSAIAAVGAIAAAFVPIAVWIWPSWYFGDFESDLGFTPEDGLTVDKLILGILAAVLLLLAALSAALFVDRTEDSIAKDAIATD
ncbi:hypothetical protein [Gordonia sp. (in: high G+C Gram-positive bacteria)]|uniref:hypothetical protein n=1 Tax=Gordonia sp. (in: high G+C Gram-positive bacteria) TaxID=84139 RepID=UPI0016B3A478|nr:hypothetical protein [Gordonia sp. (in: high G+C Gram-positive bacteria)]NLG45974.1 hypothetical protein [Gordonia sp. (in: high G+C Gram-positive bacteria)]